MALTGQLTKKHWLILLTIGFLAIIAIICALYIQNTSDYRNDCEEKGGNIVKVQNGHGYLCISDDGRIIEP